MIEETAENDKIEYHPARKGHSLNRVFYELLIFAIENNVANQHHNECWKEELRKMYLEILDFGQICSSQKAPYYQSVN